MAHFRLAHLSDLHFSSGVYAHAVHEHSIVRLRGVERFFSDTTFDRVLVTGDLTNAGDPDSLLRARTWLFSDFETAPNDRIGLRLDPKRVIVVPGNHDAFNCRSHSPKPLSLWQKSLDNYNTIFEEHSLRHPQSVRFDWVEKEGVGLFIVYADTSYIGDGELDDLPSFVHPLKGLPDMAKGKFTRAQTEQILEWFDRGVRGKLTAPGANEHIPRQQFMDSLKIMVAHHYLFEAPGQKLTHTCET